VTLSVNRPNSDSSKLNVALYTYSTQPRGGVVHTLSLAEHLMALGHGVHIYALGKRGQTAFFRPTSVPFTLIPFVDLGDQEPLDDRISRYVETYYEFLARNGSLNYEIHHAQDCISANALWRLREEGVIHSFVRTIHHIDDFTSKSLIDCQDRSVFRPDLRIVVSRYWQQRIADQFGVESTVIYNGVDVSRFQPPTLAEREAARAAFGVSGKSVLLSIGGVDPRKNSINLLRAFQSVKREVAVDGRDAVLLFAGGATLLDYRAYRDSFLEELAASGLESSENVRMLGVVTEEQVRQLYWAADALAFPSVKEGWGLVVLEALGTGLPVLASDIPVFREYLRNGENALLADPHDVSAIATSLTRLIVDDELRYRLSMAGPLTAESFSWKATAQAHVDCYHAALPRLGTSSR
jgi:glycosyltransferase-like protein